MKIVINGKCACCSYPEDRSIELYSEEDGFVTFNIERHYIDPSFKLRTDDLIKATTALK